MIPKSFRYSRCAMAVALSLMALATTAQESITDSAVGGTDLRGTTHPNEHDPKLDPRLMRLRDRPAGVTERSASERQDLMMAGDAIAIEAIAAGSTEQLLADLQALGLTHGARAGGMVSGLLPITAIDAASKLPSLKHLRPTLPPRTNSGRVTSQGDVAQRSDIARGQFGVDGRGIVVGVLSNSYNRLGGEPEGVAAGELPGPGNPNGFTTPIEVVEELPTTPDRAPDEGRAMLEIVHDVAPAANLKFATAFLGIPSFANNIRRLAAAGSDVIVDDVGVFISPWFQDGLIAQAVDEVTRAGVTYLSSAGNQGRNSYESVFRPSPVQTLSVIDQTAPLGDYILHDFDPGPGVDNFQALSLAGGQSINIFTQWDDPFASNCEGCPGADTEIDIFLAARDNDYGSIAFGALANSIGGDAVDGTGSITLNLPPDRRVPVYLVIGKRLGVAGPNPNPRVIKWIDVGDARVEEYATNSSTIFGHANSSGAIAVGAADYRTVNPDASTTPPVIEGFSSAGGTTILFDPSGNRSARRIRAKPEVVGPDNANTSFFFAGFDPDNDGIPNFPGTSAAAPHVAGVAALMLQASNKGASPAIVKYLLLNTAVDMDDPLTPRFDNRFDFGTGFGFVQADQAVGDAAFVQPGTNFNASLISSSAVINNGCLSSAIVRVRVNRNTYDSSVRLNNRCPGL